MNLGDLQEAIQRLDSQPAIVDERSITYLATYPSLALFGSSIVVPVSREAFNQICAMTYGWMPRILRMREADVQGALQVLNMAKQATIATCASVRIDALGNCLHSLVGASKVLHFANDEVFPIWDSNIECFRVGEDPLQNHMSKIGNYFDYMKEVHAIRANPEFPRFFAEYNTARRKRLAALGIAYYPISPIRAIESAAFELAPSRP